MNTTKKSQIREQIDGIINTYFIRTVLYRPDMAKLAKEDLLALFDTLATEVREKALKEVAEKYDKWYQSVADDYGIDRKTPRTVFHKILEQLQSQGEKEVGKSK